MVIGKYVAVASFLLSCENYVHFYSHLASSANADGPYFWFGQIGLSNLSKLQKLE